MFSFCVILIACIMIALISILVKGIQRKNNIKAYSSLMESKIKIDGD